MTKKIYTAAFKAQVVLEVLREEKQIGEIALERGLNPNLIRNWKREFLAKSPRIFEESKRERELTEKERRMDAEQEELLKTIGQLTIERDWLKKKSVEMFGPDYEKKFSKKPF